MTDSPTDLLPACSAIALDSPERPTTSATAIPVQRLASVDVLRSFDIFWIIGGGTIDRSHADDPRRSRRRSDDGHSSRVGNYNRVSLYERVPYPRPVASERGSIRVWRRPATARTVRSIES